MVGVKRWSDSRVEVKPTVWLVVDAPPMSTVQDDTANSTLVVQEVIVSMLFFRVGLVQGRTAEAKLLEERSRNQAAIRKLNSTRLNRVAFTLVQYPQLSSTPIYTANTVSCVVYACTRVRCSQIDFPNKPLSPRGGTYLYCTPPGILYALSNCEWYQGSHRHIIYSDITLRRLSTPVPHIGTTCRIGQPCAEKYAGTGQHKVPIVRVKYGGFSFEDIRFAQADKMSGR